MAVDLRYDLRMYWLSLKTQIRAAMALRTAFIIQIASMIINNLFLIAAWLFFFNHFGTINGWGAAEFIGSQGILMMLFGGVFILSVGIMDLPRHVDTGSLDSYLTKPTSLIGSLASSNIDVTTFGDFILGLILVVWYCFYAQVSWLALAVFALVVTASAILFWCFAVLGPNIVAFYMYDSLKVRDYAGRLLVDSSLFPVGILTGKLRTFLILVFPLGMMAAVPLDVLRGVNLLWAFAGCVASVFWLWFFLWLFKRSVKKYESSNLVGAR